MNSSPLAALEMAPIDPIISVSEAFVADTNANKVNLSIGIYCNDSGKVPILDCITIRVLRPTAGVSHRMC